MVLLTTMAMGWNYSVVMAQWTMELLLASPLKPREIILGKVTPYVLLSFVNAMTIVLLGFLVFDVPVVGSLWLLMLECMLYITLALSLVSAFPTGISMFPPHLLLTPGEPATPVQY